MVLLVLELMVTLSGSHACGDQSNWESTPAIGACEGPMSISLSFNGHSGLFVYTDHRGAASKAGLGFGVLAAGARPLVPHHQLDDGLRLRVIR